MTKIPLVLQLQDMASNNSADISELIRRAYLVASKLEQQDFVLWLKKEMKGYMPEDELPEFRIIPGYPVFLNPRYGECPIRFPTSEMQEKFCMLPMCQSVHELIDLSTGTNLKLSFPPEGIPQRLASYDCYFKLSPSCIKGIIEKIRDTILDWSIALEKLGILGEGLSFSSQEIQNAKNMTTYNINNSQGVVLGNVHGHTVQIQGYSSIHKQLEELGVPKDQRRELEDIMDAHAKASPEEKVSWATKGLDWLARNANNIGTLANCLRPYFGA